MGDRAGSSPVTRMYNELMETPESLVYTRWSGVLLFPLFHFIHHSSPIAENYTTLYNFLGGDRLKRQRKEIEIRLAKEFDRLEAASRDIKTPAAPPDEFENILGEMKRRGINPRVRKELGDGK